MPKLSDVSRLFDRVPILDPSTGQCLFMAQILGTGEPVSDAFQAYRRSMSTGLGARIPGDRAVSALGRTWIVGASQPEGLDSVYRAIHTLHLTPEQGRVQPIAEFLAGFAPTKWWMDAQWQADRTDVRSNSQRVSSSSPQEYTIILPSTAPVQPMDVVQVGDVCVLVKAVSSQPSGFKEARGFKQGWTLPTLGDLNRRTYNAVAGEYLLDMIDRVPVVMVRWQEVFSYDNAMDSKYLDGDGACLTLGVEPTTADTLFVGDERWGVVAVRGMSGCWQLHLRRA